MKAYEDEMERLATVLAERVCTKIGYEYEKRPHIKRRCYPKAPHRSDLCNACKINLCPRTDQAKKTMQLNQANLIPL